MLVHSFMSSSFLFMAGACTWILYIALSSPCGTMLVLITLFPGVTLNLGALLFALPLPREKLELEFP